MDLLRSVCRAMRTRWRQPELDILDAQHHLSSQSQGDPSDAVLPLLLSNPEDCEYSSEYSTRQLLLRFSKPHSLIYSCHGELRLVDNVEIFARKFLLGVVTPSTLVYQVHGPIPPTAACQMLKSQEALMQEVVHTASMVHLEDSGQNGTYRPMILSNHGGGAVPEKMHIVYLSGSAVPLELCKTLLDELQAIVNQNHAPVDESGVRRIIDPDPWAIDNGELVWVPAEFRIDWVQCASCSGNGGTGNVCSLSRRQRQGNNSSHMICNHVWLASPLPDLTLSSMANKVIASVFRCITPALCQVIPSLCDHSQLQVIVKAQSYELPDDCSYTGAWHREGVEAEHIAAVGLYYPYVDPQLAGGAVRFRPFELVYGDIGRAVRPYWPGMSYPINAAWWPRTDGDLEVPPADGDDLVIPVESGTCIVFGNRELVHRVEGFSRRHDAVARPTVAITKSEPVLDVGPLCTACRVVLAFFVIDPTTRIRSTQHTGYRKLALARDSLRAAFYLHPVLRQFSFGILSIICCFSGHGIDDVTALQTQLEIRRSRQPKRWDAALDNRPGHMDAWMAIDAGIMEFSGEDGKGVCR